MRRVRFTTMALGLFVSITVVPALPVSANDDELNRCTRFKVAMQPVRAERPADWGRAIRISGPRRCAPPPAGLAGGVRG